MPNPHNATGTTGESAKDNAKDKASGTARDVRDDIDELRQGLARMTQQMSDLVSQKGGDVWQRAKTNFDGVISDAESKGMEAVDAVREVGDNVAAAIDKSLKERPYTTLALALGIGFLFGATWRR
jgi:ElaB/YqjD/DUF883 family membrane-anchored ribosome-binding protein